MKDKLTQHQLAEKARRAIASRNEGFSFILATDPPTKEELAKLRNKRPSLWNSYPDKAAR